MLGRLLVVGLECVRVRGGLSVCLLACLSVFLHVAHLGSEMPFLLTLSREALLSARQKAEDTKRTQNMHTSVKGCLPTGSEMGGQTQVLVIGLLSPSQPLRTL